MINKEYTKGALFLNRQCFCRWGKMVCILLWIPFFFLQVIDDVFAQGNNITQGKVIQYRRWFVPEEQIDNSLFLSWSLPMDRQVFEQRLQQLEKKAEEQSTKQPFLSKIFLRAKLENRQLTSGEGVFTFHPLTDSANAVRLDPLALAVNSLHWTDNTEAILLCGTDGSTQLKIPPKNEQTKYDSLHFRWSLQSKRNYRNRINFDISLPPCLSIEMQIDLPKTMTPSVSAGLVQIVEKSTDVDAEYNTWRILLGHHSQATLTITADKTSTSMIPKTAIRQLVRHQISPKGLNTLSRIMFDNIDIRPDELTVKLDAPLRPVTVKYGEQTISWTKNNTSSDVTEIHIDLTSFAEEEIRELSIESLAPLQENLHWKLPRVHVSSPNVFWVSTRCAIYVDFPLRTRHLACTDAVQDTARNPIDWAERDLYVFQFFQEDAQVELEVFYAIPKVSINSVTQTDWNNTEMRSTIVLACSVAEGERFILNFPVSEHWIIDSVTTYTSPSETFSADENPVLLWNMLDEKTLSVQLRRPLKPQSSVLLQLSCRFNNRTQNKFRLAELSPLVLPQQYGENHYIATQLDLTDYAIRFQANEPASTIPQTVSLGGYSVELRGNRYLLDSHTREIPFELEKTYPSYTADISGMVEVSDRELISTYRVRCTPIDSSIDRVFVHFTPFHQNDVLQPWTWSMTGDSNAAHPLRTRKLSSNELKELQPLFEPQNHIEDLERGEVWEIRLHDLHSSSFELSANLTQPLTDSMAIPLASCPLASSQQGKIMIDSPQSFDYQIVSSHLDSLPIAPVSWNQYQYTHAAFRYEPHEELRRSQSIPLLLQKTTPDEQIASAWVWSLRLDSQYEPEGMVKNKALFLLENRGKDALQITLPHNIQSSDVSIVWLDSEQIPWQYNEEQNTIDIDLPAGQRFVSIVLEYTYQDIPLTQQRKLRPRYPAANVPILSGSWISWFPPEFDVSLRRAADDMSVPAANKIVLSKALEYLTTGPTYRTFFKSAWDNIFYSKQRRLETESAARYFFQSIAKAVQETSTATWGDLIGNEKVLSDVKLLLAHDTNRVERLVETKLLIDTQALTFLGITPATPIGNAAITQEKEIRERFERAGLVLLIASRARSDGIIEYVFAITTPATLSLNRQLKPISVGHCVRMVPYEFIDAVSSSDMMWIPAPRWLSETPLSAIPWMASAQIVQRSALTSDWNAYTLPMTVEQALYIVHRQKIAAYQWIAFLALILLSCRKPFSSPIVLLALLIVFEITARSVAPCHMGIPSGAFLGILAALGFMLIRLQVNRNVVVEPVRFTHSDSTECSASFVQTSLLVRSILLFAVFCVPAYAQTFTEKMPGYTQKKEPYRVVYPTDSQHRVVGNKILLPAEFYDLLFRDVEQKASVDKESQWHFTKAVYQGSLVFGTSAQLECSEDFKAVYDIHLDSTNATISLPNILPIQGRYYWDSKPILAIDSVKNDTLSFLIENETPGKHTLEIALLPKIVQPSNDDAFQIAFEIPKIPDSTLQLNVPTTMPPISIAEVNGAVSINSTQSPLLTAELGSISRLALSWIEDPNKNESLVSEVEQFFRIQAKASQIELKALFRFRIAGGEIRYLTIQHDPRWSRSGQFQCDEHQLVQRPEMNTEMWTMNYFSDSPTDVTQIDFQSPVSGTVTLRADFVLRDFSTFGNISGIGNLRLPEFNALQSRITKSMLAVYADPQLEVNGPSEGHSSGFEMGWQGTTTATNLFALNDETSFLEFAGSIFSGQSTVPQGQSMLEYDLAQTDPNWTLNIRTKKSIPKVVTTQSIQFASSESKIYMLGEFSTDSNIFQQYFTLDPSIHIETVEVWDTTRNEIIPSRFIPVVNETIPNRYMIFFKNPVTKKYTITIHGTYKTDIQAEAVQQAVPLLTFNDSQVTDSFINFFRTSTVMTEIIAPEQSNWTKIDASAFTPPSFSPSTFLGTWQKTNSIASTSQESVAVHLDKPTELTNELPRYVLSYNRPNVKCKTVVSLQPSGTDDSWEMTLDCTCTVTGGELKSLQFQWEDRFGTIKSIEPKSVKSVGQFEGKPSMIITPEKPIEGEQKFKIIVALNVTGTNSTLPNIIPLAGGSDQFASEIFVDIPQRWDNEIIPWELTLLEAVDDAVADNTRQMYRAVESNYKIAINRNESKLTALFYDIGFLVRQKNSILGVANIDLRNRGQDTVIVQMPPGYELIQISSAGVLLNRTQIEESNRWKVNIGINNYPQRYSILFRTSLPKPLQQWNREQVLTTLQFPLLEGVTVQETLWTVMFEGNLPSLKVSSAIDRVGETGMPTLSGTRITEMTDLGSHLPLSGSDAARSLVGINLIREYNLLRVLNSLQGTILTYQDEAWYWFAHWSEEWNTLADKVDFQTSHMPLSPQEAKPILVRSGTSGEKKNVTTGIAAFLETMGVNSRQALRDLKEQRVLEKFGETADSISKQSTPILNSQVYWQGRISEKTQYLFGIEEGQLNSVSLTSEPDTEQWKHQMTAHIWLWISLALLFPIFLLLAVHWVYWMELWLQFPHFWGMIVGVLLWTFVPQSFIGLIIIVLTFISLFRPAWRRHHPTLMP